MYLFDIMTEFLQTFEKGKRERGDPNGEWHYSNSWEEDSTFSTHINTKNIPIRKVRAGIKKLGLKLVECAEFCRDGRKHPQYKITVARMSKIERFARKDYV